jgi:hypothetical protein
MAVTNIKFKELKKMKRKKIISIKRFFFITVALFALCSCNSESNKEEGNTLKKVIIKRPDATSVYQIDSSSKVQSVNTVNHKTGISESRVYTYNDANDLQMIKIDNSAHGTSYMYYQTQTRRSDGKIESKTKTVSKARGTNETYTMKYHYDDDGKFLGVEMRDGKQNIFTKGVEE